MGTYGITKEEYDEAIEELLDSFQGEVYKSEFLKSCKRVADKYKYWSGK